MINLKIRPFLVGKEHAVELEEFEPKGGYEPFLKDVCLYLGAIFVKWHQGIEIGVGDIVYKGYKMSVFWTDFPFSLSFDCKDEPMAIQLQKELENYFHLHEDRYATAWKQY